MMENDNVFGQAVKLKEHQVRESRKQWLQLPRIIRESLYQCMMSSSTSSSSSAANLVLPLRYLPITSCFIADKIEGIEVSSTISKCIEESENHIQKAKQLQIQQQQTVPNNNNSNNSKFLADARDEFGKAAIIFCYVLPLKSDWHKKGFGDEDLKFIVDFLNISDTLNEKEETENEIQRAILVCKSLIGFSICSFKMNQCSDCSSHCKFLLDRLLNQIKSISQMKNKKNEENEPSDASSSVVDLFEKNNFVSYLLQSAFWYARAKTESTTTSTAVDTDQALEVLKQVREQVVTSFGSLVKPQQQQENENNKSNLKKEQQLFIELESLISNLMKEKQHDDQVGKKMFSKAFTKNSDILSVKSAENNNDNNNNSQQQQQQQNISDFKTSWNAIEQAYLSSQQQPGNQEVEENENNNSTTGDVTTDVITTTSDYSLLQQQQLQRQQNSANLALEIISTASARLFQSLSQLNSGLLSLNVLCDESTKYSKNAQIPSMIKRKLKEFGFRNEYVVEEQQKQKQEENEKEENSSSSNRSCDVEVLNPTSGIREKILSKKLNQQLFDLWIDEVKEKKHGQNQNNQNKNEVKIFTDLEECEALAEFAAINGEFPSSSSSSSSVENDSINNSTLFENAMNMLRSARKSLISYF